MLRRRSLSTSSSRMLIKVFYDPQERHRLHEPMTEFVLGHQMPHYHERPARHDNVLRHLREQLQKQSPIFKFIATEKDYGMDPLLRIHSPGYLDYLQRCHENWVKSEGNLESGVVGDTFPLVHRSLFSIPLVDWPSARQNAGDIIGWFFHRFLAATSWGWSWYRWLRYGDLQLARTRTARLGLVGQGGNAGYFSSDIDAPIMEGTWQAAYVSSQLAIEAAEALTGSTPNADENICATFAVCRPPGHHAHSELTGGFCYLNNAAIAAQYLIDKSNLNVLILDIDNHHGNGTQQIFYRVPNPRFISLHALPDYPWFTGTAEERGQGAGLGYTENIPLSPGTETTEYLEYLRSTLERHNILPATMASQSTTVARMISRVFKPYNRRPDILVVSLGVDPYTDDPVGTLQISQQGFYDIGHLIGESGVPALFLLEGGYDVDNIGENVGNVLRGFHDAFTAIKQ